MKYRITANFLLVVLTAYLIIPVIPVIEYLIYKDYIATNFCVNKDKPKSCCKGKCYLVKQLKKASTNTESESKKTEKRIQLKDSDEFMSTKAWQPFLKNIYFNYLVFNSSNFQLLACKAIFVPPKSASHSFA